MLLIYKTWCGACKGNSYFLAVVLFFFFFFSFVNEITIDKQHEHIMFIACACEHSQSLLSWAGLFES